MEQPKVSIVILNRNNPHIIDVCLDTLLITEDVSYETIVVDNGSDAETKKFLLDKEEEGKIDVLVLSSENNMFSTGNNIGVAHSNPDSEYVLLLNSDVAFVRPDWLSKLIAWAEDTIEYRPSIWPFSPTKPSPGPRDIVSIGWSHDPQCGITEVRPEGWCCLIRHAIWEDISPDFPWHYGLEEMLTKLIRKGARAGALSQYSSYLVHREGGSGKLLEVHNARMPDMPGWFRGLTIEGLDFTLGPNEHDSYLWW